MWTVEQSQVSTSCATAETALHHDSPICRRLFFRTQRRLFIDPDNISYNFVQGVIQ